LTSLFERYLDQAAHRISELSKPEQRFYDQDVRRALDIFGSELWTKRTRSLEMNDLRHKLGDDQRPWDASLVRAMEEEGILLKVRGDNTNELRYSVLHDALAGHLIASTLIGQYGGTGVETWIRDQDTTQLLVLNQA
jgi:hypothetical protein